MPKDKNQKLHAQPSRAFLDKYGYTIKPSQSQPGVGIVYDRYGRKVSPAEYQKNVNTWNRTQQTVREENQRRATQKEPYQEQTDRYSRSYGSRERRNQARLTPAETRRLQAQTETTLSGAWMSPTHLIGAVGRKLKNPERDLSELVFTGYDQYGPNAGITTANFAANHPGWSIAANVVGDLVAGAAASKVTAPRAGTRTAIDVYDYAGPTPRLGVGEQPAGLLGSRNLPAVRGGSDIVPIETPLGIEGRKLPTIYRSSDVGPAWTPPGAQQQLSFSPNITVRGTSEVGFPRSRGNIGTRPPIDLEQTGTIYYTTPGSPLEITPRFPWVWPIQPGYGYEEPGLVNQGSDEDIPATTTPSSQPSTVGIRRGKKPRSSNTRSSGVNNISTSGAAPMYTEPVHPDYGPAVFDAQLRTNRIPDYSPPAIAAAHNREWNAVTQDMNGDFMLPQNSIVGSEYDAYRAARPEEYAMRQSPDAYGMTAGLTTNPYRNADGSVLDMQSAIMRGVVPPEYAYGGPIFPLLF